MRYITFIAKHKNLKNPEAARFVIKASQRRAKFLGVKFPKNPDCTGWFNGEAYISFANNQVRDIILYVLKKNKIEVLRIEQSPRKVTEG